MVKKRFKKRERIQSTAFYYLQLLFVRDTNVNDKI